MTETFQILQINIVSARDLAPVSRSMQTYVVGWINPERKLTTRVDYKGNNCPEWNDRFTFRVTPNFLNSESSTIEMEIYSLAWLRDTLVGSVRVAITNLLPAGNQNGSSRRSVALQIRRPSGRPQGILNATVSVMDGSMHSMPQSGVGPAGTHSKPGDERNVPSLRRVKSERSLTSYTDLESRANRSSCKGPGPDPAPGSSLGGSMCNSDVGPSASVVAAAMEKGLYIPPPTQARGRGRGRGGDGGSLVGGGKGNDDEGSSILQCEDEPSEEGIVTKIERWKMELEKPSPPHHGHKGKGKSDPTGKNLRHKNKHHRRSKTEGGRVFRCFGKAYGFEFTIVCGGNNGNDNNNNQYNNKHNNKNNGKKKVQHKHPSDSDTNSQSYIVL